MLFFVGVPKRVCRMAHSSAERHSRRGINTFGSLIPAVISKNDKCEVPYFALKLVRETGMHPRYVHVEIYSIVSFDGVVKLPALYIYVK
jgi:hypothetical protein